MIIVKKSGYLLFKNYKFKCAIGKNGIKKKTKEGDNITPKGTFKLIKIYYRADRIKNLKTKLKKKKKLKKTQHGVTIIEVNFIIKKYNYQAIIDMKIFIVEIIFMI